MIIIYNAFMIAAINLPLSFVCIFYIFIISLNDLFSRRVMNTIIHLPFD